MSAFDLPLTKRYRLTALDLDEISLVMSGDDGLAEVVIAKAEPEGSQPDTEPDGDGDDGFPEGDDDATDLSEWGLKNTVEDFDKFAIKKVADSDLDWLIDKIGLTADSVAKFDNQYEITGCIHTNGYYPVRGVVQKFRLKRVRSAAGARFFKLPIGSPIYPKKHDRGSMTEPASDLEEVKLRDALESVAGQGFDVRAHMEAIPPRGAEEPDFAYHARVLESLPPTVRHEVIAKVRARTKICKFLRAGLDKWCDRHGSPIPQCDFYEIDASYEKAGRIVEAIKARPGGSSASYNPEYKECYDDFKRQTDEMWEFLTGELGITVEVWDEREMGHDDPYATAEDQVRDLVENKHLFVNRGGYFIGHNERSPTGTDHPWMTEDEYFRFRAVHDAFGHAAVGSGFDRHGEYAAWVAHSAMYTGPGRKAMSTEYHGVNTFLWYTGSPMPKEHWGIILPDDLIQSVFDEDGHIIRKSMHGRKKHSDAWYASHPNPKSTPKEIVGHHGHRPHGPSILWPALYEHLRRKGKTKAAAAAISNAAWKKKRMGMRTNTPTSVRGVVKNDKNQDAGTPGSTIIHKTHQEETVSEISKDDLPVEVVEYIEALEAEVDTLTAEVGKNDPEVDLLAKADPAVRAHIQKMQAEQDALRDQVSKAAAEAQERELVAKAAGFTNLTGTAAEHVELLREIAKADAELVDKVATVLKSASDQVEAAGMFSELGKGGADVTISESVEALAADIQKSDPTLTREQAVARVYEQRPDLYEMEV